MKRIILPIALLLLPLIAGCTSVVKVAPYPTAEAWTSEVKNLGVITAESSGWPLSLHSIPADYTFYSALRTNVVNKFGVPESEVVLGEVTVKISAEIDGTIRSWKASAEAGQRKVAEKSAAKSVTESLIELKKLFDAGAITQSDFDAKKKALLEKL